MNGLEAFTPDDKFILGEAPEAQGFRVACGFCAHGVSEAGGLGKVLAQWMVGGEPELDLWHMEIWRFGAHTASRRYLYSRVPRIYRSSYDISDPLKERSSARDLRLSPPYHRLPELGSRLWRKGWLEMPQLVHRQRTPGHRRALAGSAVVGRPHLAPGHRGRAAGPV